MDDGRVTAELMPQNPAARPTHLYKELEKHLASPDIVGCRVASAYVTWGGLSLVSDALEEFLRRGKQLQTIFGTGNTLTTPDALLYAHYLKTRYPKHQRARTFKWEYGNSEFHPKYYEFQYSDRVVVLVGSSNLTNGGMAFNHELSFAVTAVHSDSVGRSCERWWKWLWAKSNDVTPKLIRALREDNALGKEPAREKKPGRTEFISLKLPRAKKTTFSVPVGRRGHKAHKARLARRCRHTEREAGTPISGDFGARDRWWSPDPVTSCDARSVLRGWQRRREGSDV